VGQVWTFDGRTSEAHRPAQRAGNTARRHHLLPLRDLGDIRPGGSQGLFVGYRLTSKLELSINGARARAAHPAVAQAVRVHFPVQDAALGWLADSTLLSRAAVLNDGMDESITLRNMSSEPLGVTLRVGVQGGLRDVFEVKEAGAAGDDLSIDAAEDAIRLNRRAGAHLRGRVDHRIPRRRRRARGLGVQPDWHAVVPAHGAWGTSLHITPSLDGRRTDRVSARRRPATPARQTRAPSSDWPTGGARAPW